jgi:hypothetical protein
LKSRWLARLFRHKAGTDRRKDRTYMKKISALGLALALAASCTEGTDPEGTGGSSSHPQWLVGQWHHDEGREGYADYADYSITFRSDGTYHWQYAVSVLDGEWELSGTTLEMSGTREDFSISTNCRVMDLAGKVYLKDGASTGCPTTPAPLTSLEKCLVGKFTVGTPNGGIAYYEFGSDRTMVEFYDDPGYTSGGSSYTRVGELKLLANGDIEQVYPSGSREVRASVEYLLLMTREGSVASGCDTSGFLALGGGDPEPEPDPEPTCSLTCNSGSSCAEYDGYEACCGNANPYYCADTNTCHTTASGRDSACAFAYYGDPDTGCEAGQLEMSVNGYYGSYCAPSCSGTGSYCPSAIGGEQGECIIRAGGSATSNYCAIRCTDIGVKGGQCPTAMTCSGPTGNGLCMFQ